MISRRQADCYIINYLSLTNQHRYPTMRRTASRLFFTVLSYVFADCFGGGSIKSGL
jgi:hypothetical protein